MKNYLSLISVLALLCLNGISITLSETPSPKGPWNLPTKILDANTQLTFEVDSTWHTVHGTTSNLSGDVFLENPNDYSSVRGTIDIPVSSFDTENSSRDEELRSIMDQPNFQSVIFKISDVKDLCSPESLTDGHSCPFIIKGDLTIKGNTFPVTLHSNIKREADSFMIKGSSSFNWLKFGIEDPSIFLVATVSKEVTIDFSVELSPKE